MAEVVEIRTDPKKDSLETGLKRLSGQISNLLLLNSLMALLTAPAVFFVLLLLTGDVVISGVSALASSLMIILVNTFWLSRMISRPFHAISDALDHLHPDKQVTTLPTTPSLTIGKEAADQLINSMHQLFLQKNQIEPPKPVGIGLSLQSTITDRFAFPIVAIDHDNKLLYANKNALALVEREGSDVMGKELSLILPLRHHEKDVIQDWLADVRKNKITDQKQWAELAYSSPQRREYSFDVYGHFKRDDLSGAETVLMLIDRTEDREFENMRVDFVALAAHELRAPITVIRGYMEVFEEEVGPKLADEYKDFLIKMKVAGAQLAGFISNILDASRIDRGRLNLHFTKAAWPQILKDAVENMSLQAEALGKHLKLQIDENLPEVMVDHVSIVEVINNLIDNAIKYSPVGSTIEIVASQGDHGGLQTKVIDHGIGIPPNLVGKLFTKFYRSHRSRASFSGTGLGLYLAKAIIETHRGNIWVNSKEGQGSTFSIWLPAAGAVAQELAKPDNEMDGVTRGAHGWIKNHSMYRR